MRPPEPEAGSAPAAGTAVRGSVTVVTVTYGQRRALLEQTVSALAAAHESDRIDRLVVVANGAAPATLAWLERLAALEAPPFAVETIRLDENRGSAAGFAAGIAVAVAADSEHVWLLDDDNRVEAGALSALLDAAAAHGPACAFVSLRTDRRQLLDVAAGHDATALFGRPDSFLGFSLRDLGRKIGSRLGASSAPELAPPEEPPVIPYAPFGGLFVRREHLAAIGLPDPQLFLYGDDHEYSHRLTRRGIAIRLVPKSRVDDVQRSWNQGVEAERFGSAYIRRHADADTLRRLEYYVRNRVHFETTALGRVNARYLANLTSYLALLGGLALTGAVVVRRRDPLRCYRAVLRGVHDGLRGRLGRLDRP